MCCQGCTGGEDLGSIDPPRIPLAYRACRETGGIRSGTGLGEGECKDYRPVHQAWKPAFMLFLCAEAQYRLSARKYGDEISGRERPHGASHFFEHDRLVN